MCIHDRNTAEGAPWPASRPYREGAFTGRLFRKCSAQDSPTEYLGIDVNFCKRLAAPTSVCLQQGHRGKAGHHHQSLLQATITSCRETAALQVCTARSVKKQRR